MQNSLIPEGKIDGKRYVITGINPLTNERQRISAPANKETVAHLLAKVKKKRLPYKKLSVDIYIE